MTFSPYVLVLFVSTFTLSALWLAILFVLVRIREADGVRWFGSAHIGVELAWAAIPVVLALAVLVPTLQQSWTDLDAAGSGPRVADVAPQP